MGKKKVTLSVDDKTYSKFQKYCEENAMNFSKKIDLLIREFLKGKKVAVFLFLFLGMFLVGAVTFIDNSQGDFDSGVYSNTTWNGSAVVLSGANLSGEYLSGIFDSGKKVKWDNFTWTTTPSEFYERAIFYPTYAEDEFGEHIPQVTAAVSNLGGTQTWERVEVQSWNNPLSGSEVIDRAFAYCHVFYYDSGAYVGFQVSNDSGASWSGEECLQPIVSDKTSYRCDLTENFGIDNVSALNNLDLRCSFPNSTQGDYYSTDWVHLLVYYNASTFWNNSGENLKRNSYFFGVDGAGDVFNSNDSGFLWRQTVDNFGRASYTQGIFSYGNYIYIISDSPREVWRSEDFGASFTVVNDTFADSALQVGDVDSEGNLFVVDGSGDVYESSDSGETWSLKGDFNGGATNNALGIAINSSDAIFVVEGDGSVYFSLDSGVSWTEQNADYGGSTGTDGMAVDNLGDLYILLNYDVYKSTDQGVSWSVVNDSFSPYANAGCSIGETDDGTIYVADCIGRFFESDDYGETWTEKGDLNGPNSNNPVGFTEYSILTDLKFQVRNCTLPDCSDASFVGPDNTTGTFFTSLDNSFNKESRFFQYKGFFDTQASLFSPEIYNVSLAYSGFESISPEINFSSDTTSSGSYNTFEQDWINVGVNFSDDNLAYSFINFNNSLVGFWKLDDLGNIAVDSSGNSNDGSVVGAQSAQGKFNNSFYFNGSTDYVSLGTFGGFKTVSMWVKENNRFGYDYYFAHNNFRVYSSTVGGNLRFGDSLGGNINSGEDIEDGLWHHIVAISDGANSKLYLDGVLKGTASLETVENNSVEIGRWTGDDHYLEGRIDDVLIFNRALSYEEVLALYNTTSYSNNFTGLSGGNYSFYSYAQDVYGNSNSTETRIVELIDNTAPSVLISSPVQGDNYSSASPIYLNYTIYDLEGDLDSCWYSFNYGVKIELSGCSNTTLNLPAGDYNLSVYANDSSNLVGIDNVSFIVINTAPNVTLVEPSLSSYGVADDIWVNFTVGDLEGDLDSCFYSLNSTSNISIGGCENFSLNLGVGDYNLSVYANDSSNLVGIDNVSFNVSNSAPTISIVTPQDGMALGYNDSINLNFSFSDVNDNVESCWYNVGGSNISIASCQNTTFDVAGDGSYTLNLYINDSAGKIASDSADFYVALNAPTIYLISPIVVYLNYSDDVEFKYIPEDIDLEACELWGNFNGTWNKSATDFFPLNGVENSFVLNLSEGNYRWNVACNDSQGHKAFNGNKSFSVDTTPPQIFVDQPIGKKSSKTIDLRWGFNDSSPSVCTYNVYRGASLEVSNTTVNCDDGLSTFVVAGDADFILNFYVVDSAGNFNYSNTSFSVDTLVTPSGGNPGGSSGSSGSSGASVLKAGLSVGEISDFAVQNVGAKKILSWDVENTGTRYLNDCEFKSVGDYSSWITHSESKNLAAGEKYEFIFDVDIPPEIGPGDYGLGVTLVCNEINKSASFNVEVIEKTLNFEFLNIERDSPISVRVDYSLEDISEKDQNVVLEFLLFDSNNKKIVEVNDTKFVAAGQNVEFTNYLEIPEELEGEMGLLVNINSETYSGFVQENVVLGSVISGFTIFDRIGGKDTFISAGIVILFLVFVLLVVRRIKKHSSRTKEHVRRMVRENHMKVKSSKVKEKILRDIKKGGKVNEVQAQKEAKLAKRFFK